MLVDFLNIYKIDKKLILIKETTLKMAPEIENLRNRFSHSYGLNNLINNIFSNVKAIIIDNVNYIHLLKKLLLVVR
jgi:hypothetical protein